MGPPMLVTGNRQPPIKPARGLLDELELRVRVFVFISPLPCSSLSLGKAGGRSASNLGYEMRR